MPRTGVIKKRELAAGTAGARKEEGTKRAEKGDDQGKNKPASKFEKGPSWSPEYDSGRVGLPRRKIPCRRPDQ